MLDLTNKKLAAYIIGVALGDGNLSNPNRRAVRLRITCDKKYPHLVNKIEKSLKKIAPHNKVSRVNKRSNCLDISCYSNQWEKLLGWQAEMGSKYKQKVGVPDWVLQDTRYIKSCLCGLFETDGSIYKDRDYLTANFVTQIPNLATSVDKMLNSLNYKYSKQQLNSLNQKSKFTFRIHKNAKNFVKEIGINKS